MTPSARVAATCMGMTAGVLAHPVLLKIHPVAPHIAAIVACALWVLLMPTSEKGG